MKTIKTYSVSPQSKDSGAAKGTSTNPYTQEEFNSMLNSGTWKGGYVDGMGYVLPEVNVKGSSGSFYFSFFDSWSDPWGNISNPWGSSDGNAPFLPSEVGATENRHEGQGGGNTPTNSGNGNVYPQIAKTISGTAYLYHMVENIGGKATFQYKCGVRISGNTMSIGVNIQPGNFVERNFWATAIVRSNGGGEEYHKLSYNKQGYIYDSGWTVIGDVSFRLPASGNVTVGICIGYNYDTGVGNTSKSDIINIYPF